VFLNHVQTSSKNAKNQPKIVSKAKSVFTLAPTTGGGNIRPAKANFFSFDFAFLAEMWPARH